MLRELFRQAHLFRACLQNTWHAGPLFKGHSHMDFYNLELADTYLNDHDTHDYKRFQGMEFELEDAEHMEQV